MVVGIYKQTANNIMSKHLVTIRAHDTVHDALLLMAENRIAALPVVNRSGKCLGMIAQSDIIDAAREKDLEDAEPTPTESFLFRGVSLGELTEERVEDLMSERVVMGAPEDTIPELADKMLEAEIHHIPIVDEQNRLIGIVSTMDILAALREPLQSSVDHPTMRIARNDS